MQVFCLSRNEQLMLMGNGTKRNEIKWYSHFPVSRSLIMVQSLQFKELFHISKFVAIALWDFSNKSQNGFCDIIFA